MQASDPGYVESMAGRLALVGSGEYLPVMQGVEEWLFGDGPRIYVQLATAAAPEGQRSLDHWHSLGREAARRVDAEQVVVDIRTREDADDPRWVPMIERAGLIYLSGGNPTYLADTLRGTHAWSAIESTWRAGAALAGCSAGAMAMGGYVQHFRHPRKGGVEGLGVVPRARVLPHFDRYTRWMPDMALRPIVTEGAVVLGIDEDTALVAEDPGTGSPEWTWEVRGRQAAYLVTREGRRRIENPIALDVRS